MLTNRHIFFVSPENTTPFINWPMINDLPPTGFRIILYLAVRDWFPWSDATWLASHRRSAFSIWFSVTTHADDSPPWQARGKLSVKFHGKSRDMLQLNQTARYWENFFCTHDATWVCPFSYSGCTASVFSFNIPIIYQQSLHRLNSYCK